MYGKFKPQLSLHDVGSLFNLKLPKTTFFGQLAATDGRLFKDEDFEELYEKANNGRPSIPPSQLALVVSCRRVMACLTRKPSNIPPMTRDGVLSCAEG
jgi:hypothetical protein